MNVLVEKIMDEGRGMWRFRWLALTIAACTALLGWIIVFALPDMYEANARVFVDTRSSLKPALQGLIVDQDVNAQINYVRQSLLGGPELEKIATEAGLLDNSMTDSRLRMKVINEMRQRVDITVKSASEQVTEHDTGGSIYGVVYQDRVRKRGLKIVKDLLDTLIENTLGGKLEGSQNAQKFLETQLKEIEGRLRAAESRLADFKKRNVGTMPSEQGGYFNRLQNEIDAVKAAESALALAVSRRDELSRQLRGEAAVTASAQTMPTPGASGIVAGGDTVSRIREAQARLDELLLRFTDKHPDVMAAQATLEELKRRRAAEIESLRRGDENAVANSGVSTNPVYQSIQLAINQTDVEIATQRRKINEHSQQVAELRRALDTMPGVEAEFAQLNRDYDVNKAQYTALLTQLEKARLGESADSKGSVRFEVIEPPNSEYEPVSPKRTVLSLVVFLAAIASGGGIAFVLNRLRPVFWSVGELTEAAGVNVLGSVSSAFPSDLLSGNRRDVWACAGIVMGLLFMTVVVVFMGRHGVRI